MLRTTLTRSSAIGLPLWAASALLHTSPANAADLTCDAWLAAQRPVFQTSVDLGAPTVGTTHLSSRILVPGPTATDALLIVSEHGVDVVVSAYVGGQEVGRAASPLQRTGKPRLRLKRSSFAEPLSLRFEGTGSSAQRKLGIQLFNFASASDSACAAAVGELAAGDAAYAAAESTTAGSATAPQTNTPAAAPVEYRSAANHYLAAMHLLQAHSASPGPLLADAQLQLSAVLYDALQDWSTAREWARSAEQTFAAIDDPYGKARAAAIDAAALMEVALAYSSPTSGKEGRRKTHQALLQARTMLGSLTAFHASRDEPFDQALAQNNIGLAFYYEGSNEQAISAYRSALGLFERLDEERWQQVSLQNIALAENELGRVSQAITQYEQVLHVTEADDDPVLRASVLNNCAAAYWTSGRFDLALQRFVAALELERRLQNAREQARSLHGIGSVYESLGEAPLALEFYQQSLALLTKDLDPRGRAAALRTTANILRSQGRADEALVMHQEALTLASTDATRAQIEVQVARDLGALGRWQEALSILAAVITNPASGNEVVRSQARLERGQHSIVGGDLRAGEADLRSALKIFHTRDSPIDEFTAWVALAQSQQRRGSLDQALVSLEKALGLAEQVRLQSSNPELRASLLQPLRPAVDLKIALLAQQYRQAVRAGNDGDQQRSAMQALSTSERARARALEDYERLDTAGAHPELLEKRRTLYRELAAHHSLLESRRDHAGEEDARVRAIRTDIATLRAQLDETEAQIDSVSHAGPRTASGNGRWAALDLEKIPPEVAIVEYWLGEQEAIAWVLTRGRLDMTPLGPSAKITDAARAFQAALSGFGSTSRAERLRESDRLSNLVIKPISALIAGRHTLIFAPDQVLHYVPFAALRTQEEEGSTFLIERHDVLVTASARSLLDSPPRPALAVSLSDRMLLVSDPVYARDDERFATRVASRRAPASAAGALPSWLFSGSAIGAAPARLPGTSEEAALIASLLPTGQVDALQGFSATKDRFLRSPLEQYAFIHVASHATTNAEVPGLSALVLSLVDSDGRELDGGVLVSDLSTLRLNANLVVLSACDTALGKSIAGEGLIGLRYIMQARGARSVIASLWEVPDAAAAQLMGGFYRAYLGGHVSVGAALGTAMRALLSGRFSDPSQWSAFTATVSDFGGVQ